MIFLEFSVLPCDIPTILGMPFLTQCNPRINWKKRVCVLDKGSRSISIMMSVYGRNNSTSRNNSIKNSANPVLFSNVFDGLV